MTKLSEKQRQEEFWQRNAIANQPAGAFLAEPAVAALEAAHEIFSKAFDQAPLPKETSGIALRAFENLSDRVYEQAVGMLVCLGTGSGAAAETLARTVIEASFNLLFIADQNHERRLFAYFFRYFDEHARKLDEWQESLRGHTMQAALVGPILMTIETHRQGHTEMLEFIKKLADGLELPKPPELANHWPNSLYRRCEQIARTNDYLTSYHRLSASSHIGAEETVRWLIGYYLAGIGEDKEMLNKMGVETVMYAAMMTRMAVLLYIDAIAALCTALDSRYDTSLIERLRLNLMNSIEAIASEAGCPDLAE
jgi:hypothetical protein